MVVLGPALLIAFWGFSFVRECVLVLLSTGTPVIYDYETQGGYLRIRAEGWQLDLDRNFFSAEEVTVREPDGTLIGRADGIDVQNAIPWPWKLPKTIDARASDVDLRVIRMEDGSFRIASYAPIDRGEPPSDIPFRVVADHATVRYIDRSGGDLWVRNSEVTGARVYGVGDRWVASLDMSIEGVGSAEVSASAQPGSGIVVDGVAQQLDLAQVFEHIIATPDLERLPLLADVRADRLVVDGPMRVFLPEEGEGSFLFRVAADARNLVYANRYRAEEAHFEGAITNRGLEGVATAVERGVQANFTGTLDWGEGTQMAGRLEATATGSNALPSWAREMLPAAIGFRNGDFEGWLSYVAGEGVRIDGLFDASRLTYADQAIAQPRIALSANSQRMALLLRRGAWQGTPVAGSLNYFVENGALEGLIRAEDVPIQRLARQFGFEQVQGLADAQAIIGGTTANPSVAFRAQGNASVLYENNRFRFSDLDIAGRFENNLLSLRRISAIGDTGVFNAEGTWNSRTDALEFDLLGTGIPVSAFLEDLQGSASFIAQLRGSLANPVATGRAEVYGAKYEDTEVPLVLADILVDKTRVVASNLNAFRGAGKVQGTVAMRFRDQAISGNVTAENIDLSDYLGDLVTGLVSVPEATISGTLSNPQALATIRGQSIVARDVQVNDITARVSLDDRRINFFDLLAQFEQGQMTGSGTFDLDSESGTFHGDIQDLEISKLLPDLSANVALSGLVDSSVAGNFSLANGLESVSATGDLSNVEVNEVELGGGSFEVQGSPEEWTVSGALGTLERFVELTALTYRPEDQRLVGDISAFNLAIGNLYDAARPYVAVEGDPVIEGRRTYVTLPAPVASRLESLEGDLNAHASITGDIDDPTVELDVFEVSALQIDGQEAGRVQAQASRGAGGIWDIRSLTWQETDPESERSATDEIAAEGEEPEPPGSFSASGRIEEKGNISLEGRLNNLDMEWLARFEPNLARFPGQINVPLFDVSGPTQSPVIHASFDYRDPTESRSFTMDLTAREGGIANEGGIRVTGSYYLEGFTGPVVATIPFYYPFTIPQDEPIIATLSLPGRQLQDMGDLFPWLDAQRTQGSVSGELQLSGTLADLQITGGAHVEAQQIAARDIASTLINLNGDVNFDGKTLAMNAIATGSDGGTVEVKSAQLDLANFAEAIQQNFNLLFENPVTGTIALNDFRLNRFGISDGQATGTISTAAGGIQLSGTLGKPVLSGTVAMSEGLVDMPSEFPQGESELTPVINPEFDIDFIAATPIEVRSGSGSFSLLGSGTLQNTLTLPRVDAEMVVQRGSLRLPNARISVEPGGTITLSYQATPYGLGAPAPEVRAELDLSGRTFITTLGPTGSAERYEITLQIRGNLLEEGGLILTAQSDPPDLSQDRILTLLGQGDILAGGPGAVVSVNPEEQIRNAVTNLVLPQLVGGITEEFARAIGFEYFAFEYNPFDRLSITAAVALGPNLVLSGRRQLSNPLPGERLKYDIRLTYRIPFGGSFLRRLRLSLGFDQDRPWKLSLEYGFRF